MALKQVKKAVIGSRPFFVLCLAVLVAAVASAVTGCGGGGQATSSPSTFPGTSQTQTGAESRVIFVRSEDSKYQGEVNQRNPVLIVEVARTTEQRTRGLMQRDSLAADRGMIFVYTATVTEAFWMKDTYIPLAIAFVSSDLRIVDIQEMEPRSEVSHHPAEPYMYAIEANGGFYESNGIRVGDSVVLKGI